MNISILGAGVFGKALGKILEDNGHATHYYDPAVFPDTSLEDATREANAVIIAVPSYAVESLLRDYPTELISLPTILATKGLTNLDLFEGFSQFSVISGPAFAEEIMAGKPATFTTSAPFAMSIFKNNQINIELCDDPFGVTLCGTLKNIYAIGAGYHSGSQNDVATFIEHAHNEMADYLERHGAERATASLACGIGDLILSCTNVTSRNYTCGQRLKAGEKIADILNDLKTVEGYNAAQSIDSTGYPLLSRVKAILAQAA